MRLVYGEIVRPRAHVREVPVVLLVVTPVLYTFFVKLEILRPYNVKAEAGELPTFYQGPPPAYKSESA